MGKVARPQTTKSMVATVFARQPAMSARQFGATFAEITVASREALRSVHINQVDTCDAPSALRSLSALSDGDLDVLEEATRLRRGLEPESSRNCKRRTRPTSMPRRSWLLRRSRRSQTGSKET